MLQLADVELISATLYSLIFTNTSQVVENILN